jgi:hypothetical protein
MSAMMTFVEGPDDALLSPLQMSNLKTQQSPMERESIKNVMQHANAYKQEWNTILLRRFHNTANFPALRRPGQAHQVSYIARVQNSQTQPEVASRDKTIKDNESHCLVPYPNRLFEFSDWLHYRNSEIGFDLHDKIVCTNNANYNIKHQYTAHTFLAYFLDVKRDPLTEDDGVQLHKPPATYSVGWMPQATALMQSAQQ